MRGLRGDESGLIVSWLVRLLLVFAVAGVAIFDAGSIVVNYFTLDSTATDIANTMSADAIAGQTFFDPSTLRERAKDLAKEAGARLVRFEVDRDATVTIRLRRTASTIVVGRIGAIEDWAKATADAVIEHTN